MLLEKFVGKENIVRLELVSEEYVVSLQYISTGKIAVEFGSEFHWEMDALFKEYAGRSDI